MIRLLVAIIFMLTATMPLSAAETTPVNPRNMTFPELRFEIPKAERVVLESGTPVYLLRDPELPIINITAMVHTGSVYETADKSGLAGMTGIVMRSGGAGNLTADQLDSELEFMASAVESSIGSDIGTVNLTSLTKNFPRTLKLFADVLFRPAFDKERVEIARRHLVESIRRQNDDPKALADRELGKTIYAGHPLGHVPTLASAAAITRQEMIDFHRRFYRPDNMILAVSGDFDRSTIIRDLNTVFGGKPKAEPFRLPTVQQPVMEFTPAVLFSKKDISQTVIRLGHLGITKDNPDLYAIRLLDYILGGSFTSRLTMEIRTNQGLAYNVQSHFDVGRHFIGTFTAGTETKAESTSRTINLLKKIIGGMTEALVTDQELKTAKEYIVNSFMFSFTTPASIVTQRARLEFYNYPEDYLEKYRDNISSVKKEDLLAAARRHLKPDGFKLVVIGDPLKFDQPLSSFGPVKEIDLRQ